MHCCNCEQLSWEPDSGHLKVLSVNKMDQDHLLAPRSSEDVENYPAMPSRTLGGRELSCLLC